MRKREVIILLIGASFACLLMLIVYLFKQDDISPLHVKQHGKTVQQEWLGNTTYTQYLTAGKQAMTAQMAMLAANVDRDYTLVEHVQKGRFGFTSEATVILKYLVTYAFGFDLHAENFRLEATEKGIEIVIGKPKLLTAPAVKFMAYEIPSKGLLVDEKAAIIQLQQNISQQTEQDASNIVVEPAVIALCEKQLIAFLHAFLSKQANIGVLPAITVRYQN